MMAIKTTAAMNQKNSINFVVPSAITEADGECRVLECSSRIDVEYNLFGSFGQPDETRHIPLKDADEEWAATMLVDFRGVPPVRFQRFSLIEALVIEVGEDGIAADDGEEYITVTLRAEEDIPVLYTPPDLPESAVTALAA
jgi:hypothetical protein